MTIALPLTNVHFDLTSLLSTLAHSAVIMQTPGITRCLLNEATGRTGQKESLLNTEGINMHELFKYSDVRGTLGRLSGPHRRASGPEPRRGGQL